MKITIVHGSDPSDLSYGGVELYIHNIVNGQKTLPIYSSRKLSFDFVGISKYDNRESKNGIINKFFIVADKQISNFKFIFKLFKKIKTFDIDSTSLVHAHRIDNLLPFILFRMPNKLVCTLHGIKRRVIYMKRGKLSGIIFDISEYIGIYFTDMIIAVDNSTYLFYQRRFPKLKHKIVMIPNGVDTKLFYSFSDEKKQKLKEKYNIKNNPIILYVGRLEKEKNIEFLIDSFILFKTKYSNNSQFLIVGEGKQKDSLKSYVERKIIDDSITFLGKRTQKEVVEMYNISDLNVLGSLTEASPTTIREALACNVPIVTTPVGDIKDIFGEIKGIKFANSKETFADSMREILLSGKYYDFSNYKDLFDIKHTIKKTINIYKNLSN